MKNQPAPMPSLEAIINVHIQRALQRSRGNQSLAARLIDVNRGTLHKRVKKYDLMKGLEL